MIEQFIAILLFVTALIFCVLFIAYKKRCIPVIVVSMSITAMIVPILVTGLADVVTGPQYTTVSSINIKSTDSDRRVIVRTEDGQYSFVSTESNIFYLKTHPNNVVIMKYYKYTGVVDSLILNNTELKGEVL